MKITSIKQQVKQNSRYSVFVDQKYAFSLSESALIESGLHSGLELTPNDLQKYKKLSGTDKAYGQALRYVAMRPRSVWEMQGYLTRKGVDKPAAEAIINKLLGLGLLSDESFAKIWVANRRLLKSVSQRRLRQELRQKNVPPEAIDQALSQDEADERSVLRDIVAKKRARYPDQQKLVQYLARQGFNYDDIKSALQG